MKSFGLKIVKRIKNIIGRKNYYIFLKLKQVVVSFWDDIVRYDLFKYASAMAYTTLLGVVPAIALLCWVLAWLTPMILSQINVDLVGIIKEFIFSNLTVGAGDAVIEYIESVIQNINLTTMGISGLVGILVSMILLVRQIELALNKIWSVNKKRNMFTRFIYFWTVITLGCTLLGVVLGVVSSFDFTRFIPFIKDETSLNFSMVVPNIALTVFFFFLYKIVPNCYVKSISALVGTAFSVILFNIASALYSLYISTFSGYNKIYGTVSVVLFFLIWLYIVWVVILLGAIVSNKVQLSIEKIEQRL